MWERGIVVKEWICQEEPLIRADGASVGVGFRQMVELVRCKDCKFAFQHWNNLYRCDNYHGTPNGYGEHQGDWFCADGEAKG